MSAALPLPPGTVLAGRFEITSVLGRGGFSIAYLANDLQMGDTCTLKELCPPGAIRRSSGEIDLTDVAHVDAPKLKQRFLEEANLLGRLSAPGLLPLRDAFLESGTAYFATDHIAGTSTLESLISQEGRMDGEGGMDILFQLFEILEAIHGEGILHRDLKPSNVLLTPKGHVYLIDFGAAREWHADRAVQHTVLFTPGYAPLEQLSEEGKRGPATDIYALCATAYHMFAGYPPKSATDRASGAELVPLTRIRPDLDKTVTAAIEQGLELRFQDRPQSVSELSALMAEAEQQQPSKSPLEVLDATALRLQRFSFGKRECPACGGILEEARPLRKGLCPVCHQGAIRERKLSNRLCPCCKTGVLTSFRGKTELLICPCCGQHRLNYTKKGILNKSVSASCPGCSLTLSGDEHAAAVAAHPEGCPYAPGEQRTWAEWRQLGGRSAEVFFCDVCDAEFDLLESGKWRQVRPRPGAYPELYPDEWARVAAGLQPASGNAHCDSCDADYWLDQHSLTLLSYRHDPHGFGVAYHEQRLELAAVPMLAVGKTSGHSGLLCSHCDTEFDDEAPYLRLVTSPSERLNRARDRLLVLEDWHRTAQAVPRIEEEPAFEEKLSKAAVEAFEQGELPLDDRVPDVIWKGEARLLEQGDEGVVETGKVQLQISRQEITFGKMFKKSRLPLDAVSGVRVKEGLLELTISGDAEKTLLDIEPLDWHVSLQSGNYRFRLTVEHLACLLRHLGRQAAS